MGSPISKEPAKVLYLDQTAALGGAEISLLRLVRQLRRKEFQPRAIVGASGPLVQQLELNGVPTSVLQMPTSVLNLRQGKIGFASLHPATVVGMLFYMWRLTSRLRGSSPDLVHANSLKMCLLGGVAARLAGKRCVWHVHSIIAAPMVSPAGVRLFRLIARWIPDHIICNSYVTSQQFKVARTRLSIIPCGVETVMPPASGYTNGSQRVGMIARFAPIKGQGVFIDAVQHVAARHGRAQFVLAGTALFGEDDYEVRVRQAIARTGLNGRIQLLGFVSDVPRLIQSLDVLVHPSTAPEGFGQIVAEAMMCGKPVVASAAGGSAELIEDGVTGRLVPPGDPVALGVAIDEILSNPQKAAEMGRRARQVALERYDIHKTARAIEGVYEKVLAKA